LTEHSLGAFEDLVGTGANLDAALQSGERPFAAAAGVDLRLDHHAGATVGEQALGDGPGGVRVSTASPAGTATPKRASSCLAGMLVDVHRGPGRSLRDARWSSASKEHAGSSPSQETTLAQGCEQRPHLLIDGAGLLTVSAFAVRTRLRKRLPRQ
jgi:hypothetical protein